MQAAGSTARQAAPARQLQSLQLHSQQLLVSVEALGWGAAHDWGDGAPLAGHELGQVEQLLVLLAGPLCLFDGRVEPLIPPRLALLGRLADQQGGDAGPLVQPIPARQK